MKKIVVFGLMVILILSLCGCASMGKFMTLWFFPVRTNMLEIGQTTKEVREFCRFPNDINRTVVKDIIFEQWVYDLGYSSIYLYFENDFLVGWQD